MVMKENRPLNLGLIGAGSFGQFCLRAFSKMPELRIFAVADIDSQIVRKITKEYHCKGYTDPRQLIEDPEVEIVHIVTPPTTHYSLSRLAVNNGKHVLCEKPLALRIEDGMKLVESAKKNKRILPVNFVLRYVPVVDLVKKIISDGWIGQPLRAYFENYATDEKLPASHWFWDKKESGGIFVEHGVHFFDLYEFWFGKADVIWAYTLPREKNRQEDRVICCLKHQQSLLATHYHGFDQPGVLDRQEHHLVFERGEIIVHGWIPEIVSVKFLADDTLLSQLLKGYPGWHHKILQRFPDNRRKMKGRGKNFSADFYAQLDFYSALDKQQLYTQAIIHLMRDQISYIRNPEHQRKIQEENGLTALRLAVYASQLAVQP